MCNQLEPAAQLMAFYDLIRDGENGFDDLGLWDDPPIENEPLTAFVNVRTKDRN